MTTLNRFRIVKLSSKLQKEFGLPELICANPHGMPFTEGQAFYHWVVSDNDCEPTTAYNYLNAVLLFLTFLWDSSPSLQYTAPAEQIRNQVRDYLKERLGCVVRQHSSGNYTVKTSKTIAATSARLFLTALKRFYFCAKLKGWSDTNPLEWSTPLMQRQRFKPYMPPKSGMTPPEERKGRMPETYFCVVSGDWQPRIIDDPHLRQLLLPAFAHLRDRVIARILFDSGARVSEVLGLVMGDWRSRGQQERAFTVNKGSRGERVKEIWWSTDTAQLLRNYINNERRLYDSKGQGLSDLPDSAPLFITDEGDPYTYAAFYANWQKACEKSQLKITPHQIRHWFVTMALRMIQSKADETQREAYRQSLIAYMGWQNPETIKAYDHHIRKLDFAPTHAALARLDEKENDILSDAQSSKALPAGMNVVSEEMERWLNKEFGW